VRTPHAVGAARHKGDFPVYPSHVVLPLRVPRAASVT
jgi:hypothetical protein